MASSSPLFVTSPLLLNNRRLGENYQGDQRAGGRRRPIVVAEPLVSEGGRRALWRHGGVGRHEDRIIQLDSPSGSSSKNINGGRIPAAGGSSPTEAFGTASIPSAGLPTNPFRRVRHDDRRGWMASRTGGCGGYRSASTSTSSAVALPPALSHPSAGDGGIGGSSRDRRSSAGFAGHGY